MMRCPVSGRIRWLRVALVVVGLGLGAGVLSGGCNAIADIQEPSQLCANGLLDDVESDVDCGGPCAPCQLCQACETDFDCSDLFCDQNTSLCRDPGCDTGLICPGACCECPTEDRAE